MFRRDGSPYRQISPNYANQFRRLRESGFFDRLVEQGLLIPFEDAPIEYALTPDVEFVIKPDPIGTISYPYEWCFEQLRDAALTTLEIQKQSLESGFSLKDASAFNVQFHHGRPVFIDTLSFEDSRADEPWRAYRQFCQQFLAPLALAAYVDARLLAKSRSYMDGIPLDLTAAMLPTRARFNSGLAIHLFMHAKANVKEFSGHAPKRKLGKDGHLALNDSLTRTIRGLRAPVEGTEWANYYDETNYTDSAQSSKRSTVVALLNLIDAQVETCWDLGANNGEYSRLALERGWQTVAWDLDHGAVSQAYAWAAANGNPDFLPLIQDFANPSPRLGWNLQERDSLPDRGPADVALALALVHHMSIGNNVPLESVAEFLAGLAKWLVVEFVPKEDSQVQRMLRAREDVFADYNFESFESGFTEHFEFVRSLPVRDSLRTVHLLRKRA